MVLMVLLATRGVDWGGVQREELQEGAWMPLRMLALLSALLVALLSAHSLLLRLLSVLVALVVLIVLLLQPGNVWVHWERMQRQGMQASIASPLIVPLAESAHYRLHAVRVLRL
jgi:hypothetical protein